MDRSAPGSGPGQLRGQVAESSGHQSSTCYHSGSELFWELSWEVFWELSGSCLGADWELSGGWTVVEGKRHKDEGILEQFDVSLEEAQNLVMTARIELGWVDPEDLKNNTVEVTEDNNLDE